MNNIKARRIGFTNNVSKGIINDLVDSEKVGIFSRVKKFLKIFLNRTDEYHHNQTPY